MKNQADYSQYECPYSHIEKECGHELHGPEGYEKTYSIWCACGFRGPVFCFDPEDLKLKRKDAKKISTKHFSITSEHFEPLLNSLLSFEHNVIINKIDEAENMLQCVLRDYENLKNDVHESENV